MSVVAFLQLSMFAVMAWARKGFAGASVGCFTCQSFNESDTGCEDPFNPAFSHYDTECKQGMPGRVGLFLATFCIKMKGIQLSTGNTIMVRTCSLSNMGHQCGIFEFEDSLYKGCLTTCHEDGCNAATTSRGLSEKWSMWTAVVASWILTGVAIGTHGSPSVHSERMALT